MTDNIIALNFNGIKVVLDSNTKLIRLTIPAVINTDRTFHDTGDDSNYQVPTGKKAKIIYVEEWDMANTADKIVYADDLDGTTNGVTLWDPKTATQIANTLFMSASIPADKYINFDAGGVNSNSLTVIWIIEESA